MLELGIRGVAGLAALIAVSLLAPRASGAEDNAWPVSYAAIGYEEQRLAALGDLPVNAEIHEFWIVCKIGFIPNPYTGRGCVTPLPRGVNPTVIKEIPGSSGSWGSSKGSDVGGGDIAAGGGAGVP